MIEQPFFLAALLAGVTALGFALEARYGWAKRVSATLLIIGFGALLSNAGVVPKASPVYDAIYGPITSLAIAWLLLAVDLSSLAKVGGRMLAAFALAVAGSAAGATAAATLFARAFGPEAPKLAGVLTGTYSGGSLNFAGVARAVELDGPLFTAATAADNLVTALWMAVTLTLPLWLARFDRTEASPQPETQGAADGEDLLGPSRVGPLDLIALIAIGLALMVAAQEAEARFGGYAVLWLTTAALLVGHLPWVRRLSGASLLGGVALHLFFVVIGVGSRISEIVHFGPAVLWVTLLTVAIHGLVVFGGSRLVRIDSATAAVASQAAVGGPSTALALSAARGWPHLALPGVAVGLLGYAVGNYVGLTVAAFVTRLLS